MIELLVDLMRVVIFLGVGIGLGVLLNTWWLK